MKDKSEQMPSKLFWVDLEMTGLNPDNDLILEVAAIVTDFDFQETARYEARITHDLATVTQRMQSNPWWSDYPANRDEFLSRLGEGKTLEAVEDDLINLVQAQFAMEPAILAGNSIHQDRKFIAHWWPRLNAKLHYRMFDVSTLKIYMQGRYGLEFEKRSVHRALDDIRESMDEWQYYIERLSPSGQQ